MGRTYWMTSSSYDPGLASNEATLPVSVELLDALQRFGGHVSVIFDDLGRPTHQQPQQQQQQQQGQLLQSQQQGNYGQAPSSTRALAALSNLDERMAVLLHKAETHMKNQRRIAALEDKLVEYERDWRTEMLQLDSDRVDLDILVHNGRKDRQSIVQAEKAAIKPSTVL